MGLVIIDAYLYDSTVNIDLSGNSSGEYLIEITSDGVLLEGGFIL
ncbi:DUF3244 domain-containing protein [Bacteroides sp. AM10-21B]|jgi:hypothetical protein|nr:DUF3244 domain-containing protein [Bacteroides sp. AM10-21B]